MGNHLTFQSNPTIHTPLFYPASHIPNLSCPPLRSPPRLKSTLSFPLEALSPGAPSPTTTLSSPPEALSPGAPSPTTTLSSPRWRCLLVHRLQERCCHPPRWSCLLVHHRLKTSA